MPGIHERHIVCLPFAFSEMYIISQSYTIFHVLLSLVIGLDFDHLLILLNFDFFKKCIDIYEIRENIDTYLK